MKPLHIVIIPQFNYYSNMVKSSKIKQAREKLGLSQEKLARLVDVSNNTIINIEAGKQQNPTIQTLKKIAKALNVPIEELIK
jgi:DNA-binding XRE family transcriptional regulator